jgi:capsular exopolysaccharide synthesis family protein
MPKYDINIRDYWRIIRKRRTVVILATILFTVFSYLFALISSPDPVYQATSAVKVERATDLTTLLLGTVTWTSWDNVATQAVIINSFPIMEGAARKMGLIPEEVSPAQVRSSSQYLSVVTALKSQIETEQQENTNIIDITAISANAGEAALLANTVAEVFRQSNIEERNKKVRETREFIEKQLRVVDSRLQEAEQNLRAFEEGTRIVAIDAQTTVALNRLTGLENEVAQLKQRRREIQKHLGLLKQLSQGMQVSEEAFYMDNPPPQLAKLTAKLADLRLRRETLLNDYTEEHPEVIETDAELQNVLSEIDKELRSMLATMDRRLNDLETRLQAVRNQTMTIPESALILARLRREVDVNADLLAQLKAKYQEVMIQESGLIEEVKIVKPALEPTHPINAPNTLINTLTGAVIGLALGLVLALIVETMDTSLGTIEDVEEVLGIPVLGVIPSVHEFDIGEKVEGGARLKAETLVTHFAPRSPVSEAYRSLRTNLQFIRMEKRAKAFLVTSSSLQEGKTYNVVNLCLSLAQAGEKVLLIDADLRRPAVHGIFGLQRQPGLTDFIMGISEPDLSRENGFELEIKDLSKPGQNNSSWQNVTNTITDMMLGDFEFEDILKTPGLDNLHIISAGQGSLNPAEILRSPRFKKFLHDVREAYDVIVVDTPPVLPVADAFEVAPEVDGVVLVYEVGRIGRGILNRAKVQLENLRANVLGVILNNVKPEVAPDFYRYRTDYYYEDKSDDETSVPPSRWQDFINRGINGVRNLFSKMRLASAVEGKQFNKFILMVLIGLMLVAGLLWQYYPGLRSASSNPKVLITETGIATSAGEPSADSSSTSSKPEQVAAIVEVEQKSEHGFQGKPVLADKEPTETPEQISLIPSVAESPTVAEKNAASGQDSKAQIYESLPLAARIRSRPDINAPILQNLPQGTRLSVLGREGDWLKLKLKSGSIGWIYHSLVQEVDLTPEPPASQVATGFSAVSEQDALSIQQLVERWRHAWEEGNMAAYAACYHPDFERAGMDRSGWGKYMQNRFEGSAKRDIQLSDLHIKVNGSAAVVTFKQHYQTKTYQKYGLKTLHLRRDQDHWTIFKETVQPLAAQG